MRIERKYILKMLEYCKQKWGKSEYHNDFPKLMVRKKTPKNEGDMYGCFNYQTNIICIYINSHSSMVDICDTVVHEYTHYLQNMEKMYEKYMTKYYKSYMNHPYEMTAFRRGEKYKWECLRYVWQS